METLETFESSEIKGDPIWIDDFNQIIRRDRLFEFIPKVDMPYSERINAIVRLSIYVGVIFALLHNNYLYLYVPLIVLIITYLSYHFQSNEFKEDYRNLPRPLDPVNENPSLDRYNQQIAEAKRQKAKCVSTTKDNPFMNALPADDRTRGPACSTIDNPELANKVEANFNHNLFKDVNDVYNRRHSERQYYTMPSTTFANDRGSFVNWLYSSGMSCKEGNGNQCVGNNENRLNQASYKFY